MSHFTYENLQEYCYSEQIYSENNSIHVICDNNNNNTIKIHAEGKKENEISHSYIIKGK